MHVLTLHYQLLRADKRQMFNSSIELQCISLAINDGDRPTTDIVPKSGAFFALVKDNKEECSRRSRSERQPSALITVACPPARTA